MKRIPAYRFMKIDKNPETHKVETAAGAAIAASALMMAYDVSQKLPADQAERAVWMLGGVSLAFSLAGFWANRRERKPLKTLAVMAFGAALPIAALEGAKSRADYWVPPITDYIGEQIQTGLGLSSEPPAAENTAMPTNLIITNANTARPAP